VAARRITDRDTGAIETYDAATLQDKVRDFERNRTCTAPSLVQRAKCRVATRSRLFSLLAQAMRTVAARHPAVADALKRVGLPSAAPLGPAVPLAFTSTEGRSWLRVAWQRHLDGLAMVQALADGQRAPLLIVLLPMNFQVYPFLAARDRVEVERPNEIVARFLDQRRIPYFDLLPVLRAHADVTPRGHLDAVRDLYYRVDFHFNRRGNILAGLAVAEHIAQRGLLPVAEALPRIRDELRRFGTGGPS
jgi:hypothetical protein